MEIVGNSQCYILFIFITVVLVYLIFHS